VARSKAVLTAELFASRAGQGCLAPDPIFILGLPRAGSTLVEQILASHSAVEGTMELPDVTSMARRLSGAKTTKDESAYPEILATWARRTSRRWGRSSSSAPGCSARPTGRCSSTRCPTTSPTSA
jgi:hypothetical protein